MTYQPPPGEGQPDPAAGTGQPGYNAPPPPPPAAPPAYNPPPQAPAAGEYAPPPSPAGGAVPPQQWNAPPAGSAYASPGAGFDARSVTPLDWVVVAMGPLTFLFSLLSFYTGKATVSIEGFTRSATGHESAWHGFFGWFGAVVALLASAVVALELFSPQTKLPVPARLAALGGFALAFVCYLLAWFITPGVSDVPNISGVKVSYGRGIGFYGGLIFILAGGVISFLRFQQKGGKLPGRS